jgi:hypothetical protein
MTSVAPLPAPVRPVPPMRFKMGQIVLTPDNRVALVCGQILKPDGLMAFVIDVSQPPGKRRSQMVRYDSLRPAPCGGLVLAVSNDNRRNPFAPPAPAPKPAINGRKYNFVILDELAAIEADRDAPRTAQFFTPSASARRRGERLDPTAPIPAFLRQDWARNAEGGKLTPYSPRMAALALLAFRVWPARAVRVFDAWRLIEAARKGAIACGPSDQSLLARIASGWSGRS